MGLTPVKLAEELLPYVSIPEDSIVMDLRSGMGITSAFLATEYEFRVTAADLWREAMENQKFFSECGFDESWIIWSRSMQPRSRSPPIPSMRSSASTPTTTLAETGYTWRCLPPCIRYGGYVAVEIPGMVRDMHGNLPEELLAVWTPEQLEYIHDIAYWMDILTTSVNLEEARVFAMESNEEV